MEEQRTNKEKPINIEKMFIDKNPRLAKMMPRFVYGLINKVLHVDYLNDIFTRNKHLTGIDFANKAIIEFNVTEKLYGIDNVPKSGRFIFASNHPLGGFDSLLLMKIVHKRLGVLKFISNDVLMAIPNLNSAFVPINKFGGNSKEAAKMLTDTYDSDLQIIIFPSGLASRKIKGKVVDLDWKKHFISKAIKHKRDIIPVYIEGKNSNRFYTIANLRKFFRIKWNIEMFLLPDETLKHKNKKIPIYFGEPIPYSTFNKSKTNDEWAEWVKSIVYGLPKGFDNKFITKESNA